MAAAQNQPELIAGIDEAGRGCLAGPVAAAAVILPDVFSLAGLNDSKCLTVRQRSRLAPQIKACAVSWGIGLVWPRRIDEINILQASLEAMSIAVGRLNATPAKLAIDGNQIIPISMLAKHWRKRHPLPLPRQSAIVSGDRLVASISAASILAKTFRDGLMTALDKKWPVYGFARHKGYGTREHLEALTAFGACPMHRHTFRPLRSDESSKMRQLTLLAAFPPGLQTSS